MRARAIDCAVVKAYDYGRERARTTESTACPLAVQAADSCQLTGFRKLPIFEEYVGGSPDAPLPRSLKTPTKKRGRLPSTGRSHFAAIVRRHSNAQIPQNAASKMTDQDLLATIAGLQEQIDSMSGQLTEVRPLQFLLPLPRARCGRGAVPRPAAPVPAAATPPR